MSLFKDQMRSWSGGGFFDPLKLDQKILPRGADSLHAKGPLGNAGGIKEFAGTKLGSLHSGRAILQGGPKEQNMETGRTFDVFGSPATAGTKQQTTARTLAALYGLFMGGAALAGGGGAGGGGSAAGVGGYAGSPSGGYTGSGMSAGGTSSGATTGAGGYGPATSASPGWMEYARMGNSMMQQGQQQGQQSQPLQHQFVGQPVNNPYLMRGYPWI